jgi:hypothetical protein
MKSLPIAHVSPVLTRSTVDVIKALVNLVTIDLYNPRPHQIEIFLSTRKESAKMTRSPFRLTVCFKVDKGWY